MSLFTFWLVEFQKCCWFALPLQEIRLRHEFLVRTGAYMTPNPKKPLLSKDNPQLKEILESSDKDFATRVGGVSPQEFQVFREMFSRQLADEQSELLRESADAYEKC